MLRKTHIPVALVGWLLGALAGQCWAEPAPPAPDAIAAKIRQVLKERYPTVQIDSIHVGPLAGLYEVVSAGEILYATESADIVFVGHVVDTRTKEDLSVAHWNQYHAIDFSALPLDLAVKLVRGDGSRSLAIFEDPKCPYCKQLEQQLAKVTNITAYVFLYPLEQLHPGATDMAGRIWCASDRAAVWSSWMQQGTEPPPLPANCDITAVAKLHDLGTALRIASTPTVFFADGRRARGTMSSEQIELELAKTASHAAALSNRDRRLSPAREVAQRVMNRVDDL